ncbi:hypothetical protein [Pelagibius sp. 7325]|uniref:hypothetical protein n=1 Tax=Pelagibius sp. 7325 TaxID=3131994 RepID=UPI0030EEC4C7
MFFSPRLGLARALTTAAALMVMLGGCSFAPYRVVGSDAAADAAAAQGADLLPRLRPLALGICYSPAFNDLAEVEAEAVYRCDGGRLEKIDEDVFWNGCSMSQPNRINYICYPPDKAKRLN